MNMFCTNCGKQLAEGEKFCSSCGTPTNATTPQAAPVYSAANNAKTPGKGASIAGMVLGIIACVWGLMTLASVGSIEDAIYELDAITVGSLIAFSIGFTFFSLIPSVVGLSLSVSGFKKKKSGMNITGLILNSIALLLSIIEIIYILTFA